MNPKLAVNGVVLLNKQQGFSSNAALQRVKKLFNAKKAGHTGSLDPLATGMLPICLGEATKIAHYLLEVDKCYQVKGVLGKKTDTGDAMGDIIEQNTGICSQDDLQQVLPKFMGKTFQVPPMYSALKHQGKPLYTYARQGKFIERKAREIMIDELVCTGFEFPTFSLRVRCSKGTYIRSLVESIGEHLKLGAHVVALNRVYTAGFETEKMYTIEELQHLQSLNQLQSCLIPIEKALPISFPIVVLGEADVLAIRQGRVIEDVMVCSAGLVQLQQASGQCIGIGEYLEDGRLISRRLFAEHS